MGAVMTTCNVINFDRVVKSPSMTFYDPNNDDFLYSHHYYVKKICTLLVLKGVNSGQLPQLQQLYECPSPCGDVIDHI